jgi:hypothetical protein
VQIPSEDISSISHLTSASSHIKVQHSNLTVLHDNNNELGFIFTQFHES